MPRAPKTYSPRASTSDSCKTLLTPRLLDHPWVGFAAIKRAGFGLCAGPGRQVGWKPQRLRSYQVFCQEYKHANRPEIPRFRQLQPTRNLAAYLIAYKPCPRGWEMWIGEGFVRYQMCGFWGRQWAPLWSSVVAELIAAKPGLGWRGFAAIRCDVMWCWWGRL